MPGGVKWFKTKLVFLRFFLLAPPFCNKSTHRAETNCNARVRESSRDKIYMKIRNQHQSLIHLVKRIKQIFFTFPTTIFEASFNHFHPSLQLVSMIWHHHQFLFRQCLMQSVCLDDVHLNSCLEKVCVRVKKREQDHMWVLTQKHWVYTQYIALSSKFTFSWVCSWFAVPWCIAQRTWRSDSAAAH